MKDYFTEILMVIAYSGRTQAAIILGAIGFIVIILVGDYYLANFQLSGQMSGLTCQTALKSFQNFQRKIVEKFPVCL